MASEAVSVLLAAVVAAVLVLLHPLLAGVPALRF